MKKGFLCSRCGACCSVVGQMVAIARGTAPQLVIDPFVMAMNKLLVDFPVKTDESGKCEHLGADNLCKVYNDRPLICNVDRLYKKVFKFRMSKKEFYRNNHKNCEVLKGLNAKRQA